MQHLRHPYPALAILEPHQFRTITKSRFVLRARLPVVRSVFLKNVPVLSQLYISPGYDRRWGIVHTLHPDIRELFSTQSFQKFLRQIGPLPELQRLINIDIIFGCL